MPTNFVRGSLQISNLMCSQNDVCVSSDKCEEKCRKDSVEDVRFNHVGAGVVDGLQ